MSTPETSDVWYREPWPWFLMAGPLLAILGCMITIYLAMTRFDDQPILEGATQRGLVVQRIEPAGAPPAAAPGAAAAASATAPPAQP